MFEDLIPETAITLSLIAHRVDRIGIVFSKQHAEKLLKMYENDILVLCVKVPMCKYCLNMEEVESFFDDSCWQRKD
jgi:hypothetical protein